MSKFDMSALRGNSRLKVGSGLLNGASKEGRQTLDIRYIKEEDIKENDKNFYSVTDVDSLASSIHAAGLEQPLVVSDNGDGTFKLIAGHRRLAAIRKLKEQGKWDKAVPCIVQDVSKIDLPLEADDKELYAIIVTNHETRDYTEADTANEIKALTALYTKLRAAGVKEINVGKKEDGTEDIRQIAGIRTNELIARDAGISKGMQSQYGKVDHNGTEALKSAFQEGKISVTAAAEASDMKPEDQNSMVEDLKETGKIQPNDVKDWKRKHEEKVTVTANEIRQFSEDLLKLVPETGLQLTQTDYKALRKAAETMKKKFFGN